MTLFIRTYSFAFIVLLSAAHARAACTSPVGQAGSIVFVSPDFLFCDGTNWTTLSYSGVAGISCVDSKVPMKVSGAWSCVDAVATNTANSVMYRDASGDFSANDASLYGLVLRDGLGGFATVRTAMGFTSYSLQLPLDDGDANQVLQTDGSGVLSWVNMSSGSGTSARLITHAITNPGGESGNLSGWSADGGFPLPGIRTSSPAPHSGGNYFYGGAVAQVRMKQTLNLISEGWTAAEIDDGSMKINAEWYQASYASDDKVGLNINYYDSGMTSLGATTVTPVTTAPSQTWLSKSLVGDVPVNTRYVEVVFVFVRSSGTNSDGYVDDIGVETYTTSNLLTMGGWLSNDGDNEGVFVTTDGKVGVGTGSPATTLAVGGTLTLGNGAETCGASYIGGLRSNSGVLEFCNGANWLVLASGSSSGSLDIETVSNSSGNITLSPLASSGSVTISSGTTSTSSTSGALVVTGGVGVSDDISTGGDVVVGGRMVANVGTDADSLSTLTVDFTNSNFVRATGATAACGTLNVTNTTAGGSFTVTIPNATETCSTVQWNGLTTNVKLSTGYVAAAPVTGVVYTFIDDGGQLWVSAVGF